MSEKLNKKGLERLWHKILLLADCIYGKISALEKSMPEQAKNGKLTIQKNGTTVETFTANQSGDTTANIIIPNVINSCAVTQKGQMALDAIEKNATIEGTLAHQIAQANSNLIWLPLDTSNWQVYAGVELHGARYCPGIRMVYMIVNTEGVLIPNSVAWLVIPPEFRPNGWRPVGFCTYYLSDNNLATVTMSSHLDNARFIFEPDNGNAVWLRYGIHLPGFRHRGIIIFDY